MYPGPPAKESIELLLASAVPSDHGSHANPLSLDLGGPPTRDLGVRSLRVRKPEPAADAGPRGLRWGSVPEIAWI